MNRQMNEMMRHLNSPGMGGIGGLGGFGGQDGGMGAGPGQGLGQGQGQGFSIQIGPDGVHTNTFPPGAPGLNRQNQGKVGPREVQPTPIPKKFTAPTHDLPAYTDPNSI